MAVIVPVEDKSVSAGSGEFGDDMDGRKFRHEKLYKKEMAAARRVNIPTLVLVKGRQVIGLPLQSCKVWTSLTSWGG